MYFCRQFCSDVRLFWYIITDCFTGHMLQAVYNKSQCLPLFCPSKMLSDQRKWPVYKNTYSIVCWWQHNRPVTISQMRRFINVLGKKKIMSAKQSTVESGRVRKMTKSVSIRLKCSDSRLSTDFLKVKELWGLNVNKFVAVDWWKINILVVFHLLSKV